ncbi:MAG: hypothetical protein JWN40_3381 [Phycisphaerales bacterium]|nr:hypothetical protein [Phycisphaerales bacterium]
MRRETRANLIFLTILLSVTLPGAVVLFKKKLDPSSPPMFMPDFVRRRLPYMASQQSPGQVVRFVPELTGQWVTEINRERAGGSPVLMVGRQPLVSDDHIIQVTAMQQNETITTLYVIAWDEAHTSDIDRYSAIIVNGSKRQAARVLSATPIPMPAAVKRELMDNGVIQPANAVTWLTLQVGGKLPGADPAALELSYRSGEIVSRVQIPATGGLNEN